ncbi:MAG: protein-disulfide reductase DsbD domain-containing protein [Pseudomonadota bacterium]
MRNLLLLLLSAAMIVFGTSKGFAASTQWHDLGGGKARLLASLDPVTNEVSAALEVKLDKGWSTYWRYPGSSGIPPIFDFSGSNGFEVNRIEFPVPTLLGHSELRYAGYKNSVIFPVSGKVYPGVNSDIHLSLLIGICAEVCIPAQAEMKITADELLSSDPLARQIINFSKLTVPSVKDAEAVVLDAQEIKNQHLMIKVKHRKSSRVPNLFVEGPPTWYLEPAKLMSQTEDIAVFSLDVSRAPRGTDIAGEKLRYTLASGSTGIEFTR